MTEARRSFAIPKPWLKKSKVYEGAGRGNQKSKVYEGARRGTRRFHKPEAFRKKDKFRRKFKEHAFYIMHPEEDIFQDARLPEMWRVQEAERIAAGGGMGVREMPSDLKQERILRTAKAAAERRVTMMKKDIKDWERRWVPGMPEWAHKDLYKNIQHSIGEYRYWINTVRNIAKDIALLRTFLRH